MAWNTLHNLGSSYRGKLSCSFKILDALGQVLYKHEQMVPIGPDTKHDLLIFFKRDTTHDQIESFYPELRSHSTPGVRETLRVFPIDGYEAVAVKFFPDATQTEREGIRSKVRASPIVHKVMEHVVPQDIKKVD